MSTHQYATTNPTAPAATPSSRLSARSCRNSRPRPAPSAARTAISCRRPVARASSRLATLTHAISSTSVTARNQHQQRRLHVADELLPERHQQDALVLVRLLDTPAPGRRRSPRSRPVPRDATRPASGGRRRRRCATSAPAAAAATGPRARRSGRNRPARRARAAPASARRRPVSGFSSSMIDRPIDRRIRTELLLPQAMTEDHHVSPRLLIVLGEDTTEQRDRGPVRRTPRRAPGGHRRGPLHRWSPMTVALNGRRAPICSKDRRPRAPVEEVRRRDVALDRALVRFVLEHHDNAGFIAKRQRTNERLVRN